MQRCIDQQALLERLRRDMRQRLFDASINPTFFSVEHGISARTLHAALAASGTSFMSELTGMGLDCACTLFNDKSFGSKTIEEIAALVGLANPDHFSTRFRKSFGLSPHGWRNRNK